LDFFGRGFVLVAPDNEKNHNLTEAALQLGLPLQQICFHDEEAQRMYEKKFVLVRPDGHVAWRSDSLPHDLSAWLLAIAGHRQVKKSLNLGKAQGGYQ
jgi:hypothetical protein